MTRIIRIIGIDPGLKHTGWGIIEKNNNNLSFVACGRITTNAKEHISQRLLTIQTELTNVLSPFKPDKCAMEKTFVNKNPLSSLKLSHARGVAMVTCAKYMMSITEYAPNLVKKTVVGAGRADKNQVMTMVKILLPKAKIDSEDAADALAVAICHANQRHFS